MLMGAGVASAVLVFFVVLYLVLLGVYRVLLYPVNVAIFVLRHVGILSTARLVPSAALRAQEPSASVEEWDSIPELVGDAPKVVLMGDSVLDNFVWLKDPKQYLRVQLQRHFEQSDEFREFSCINLAVDQMSTFDFIKRSREENDWHFYEHSRKQVFDPSESLDFNYFSASDGSMYSVDNLKRLRNVKHVVVSIGGNDVYLDGDIQLALIQSLLPFCSTRREKVAREFSQRLEMIFLALEEAVPGAKIIPVIVYHPHYSFSIGGIQSGFLGLIAKVIQRLFLSLLVTPMLRELLLLAQRRKLDVIDLSRTFDASDQRHYGTEQIGVGNKFASWSGAEPSNISSNFIAILIQHVIHLKDSVEPRVLYADTRGMDLIRIQEERNCNAYPWYYTFGSRTQYLLKFMYSA